jgi:hypothetical protein
MAEKPDEQGVDAADLEVPKQKWTEPKLHRIAAESAEVGLLIGPEIVFKKS